MSTATSSTEAAEYVAGVRDALADLPEDDREELLDGLEGNLSDLAAESATPLLDRLGPPHGYADELRASAGMPPRLGGARQLPLRDRIATALAGSRLHRLSQRPLVRSTLDLLVALRPVWWLVRAWAAVSIAWHLAAGLGMSFVPGVASGPGILGFVSLVAAAVLSVQVGRGLVRPRWPRLVTLANVLLALAVLPLAAAATTDGAAASSGPGVLPGVALDGNQVQNILPFDASGHPLHGVQLFDQDGNPLRIDSPVGVEGAPSPVLGTDGTQRFNVFPLVYPSPTDGTPGGVSAPTDVMATAPPLLMPSAATTADAKPSPSPSLSAR